MNAIIRASLREAGAKAGRQARRDAGLPEHIEDSNVVQRMAEILRRTSQTPMTKSSSGQRYG